MSLISLDVEKFLRAEGLRTKNENRPEQNDQDPFHVSSFCPRASRLDAPAGRTADRVIKSTLPGSPALCLPAVGRGGELHPAHVGLMDVA